MALSSPPATSRQSAFAALKATLDRAAFAAPRIPLDRLIPSTVPALDQALGGGFPRGSLVALEGSAGRWSIAARLLAAVTRSATAAVVDDGGLYPPDLAACGVRLDRVLIVPARSPVTVARSVDVLARSKACRVVVMPAVDLRPQVWTRLASVAQRTDALIVAIPSAEAPAAQTLALDAAASLCVQCSRERVQLAGKHGVWCTVTGYGVCADIRKYRAHAAEKRARLQVSHAAVR